METTNLTQGDESSRASRTARRLLSLSVVVALLLTAASAVAQQDDNDADVPGGPLGEELEDYWSVDRDVAVVRNKIYRRKGRFGIGLHFGVMSSEPFHWYVPAGLRADYYFSDNWGLELEGSYMGADGILRHKTDLTKFVEENQGAAFDDKQDALDRFNWRAHALAVWHPFYGKLALLQRKLSHFDLNLAAGFGAVSLTRPNDTRNASSDEVKPEFAYGGGIQFFASDHVTLRMTGRAYVYSGPMNYKNTETGELYVSGNPEDENIREANFFEKLEMPTEFLLGVTYMF